VLKRLRTILSAVVRRRPFEDGLSEELRFHIDEYTEDLVRAGVPREQAARRARVEFGSVEAVRDDCRQARGLRLLDEVGQDARYAVRVLLKSRGFSATALATLAICLGANLAVFGVVRAVLLRPLPFPDPDRLVRVFNTYPKAGVMDDGTSITNYYERRGRLGALTGVSLFREGTALVGDTRSTERESVMRVSADFFTTLGAGPSAGRAFVEDEVNPGSTLVAILTDAFWRDRCHGDPGVIGRTIRVDGSPHLVVGVLPASFRFLSSQARLYLPLKSDPEDRGPLRRHSGSSSQMVGRLKAGMAIDEAQSELDASNAMLEADSPTAKMMAAAGFRSLVMPLHGEHVAAVRPVLLLVQAGAVCLLLIGGVNLVNLLLVRATARSKELAVRQAIGGSRARLVRQIVVETTMLTLGGAVLGVALGAVGLGLLRAVGTDALPLGAAIAFDGALAATGVLAGLTIGLVMAVPVAWYSLRGPAATSMSSESRAATAGPGAQRLRHGFLVAQIALAFALLSGAGLLGLSLRNVLAVVPGFRPANVLSGEITLPVWAYPNDAARRRFIERLLTELDRQPGISATGVATNIPFGGRNLKSATTVKGYVPRPGESVRGHYVYAVSGKYFEALGLSLVEGRVLDPAEIQRGARVVVVDDNFARHYWPGGSAVGGRLFPGPKEGVDADAFTIIGVVGAARHMGLTDAEAAGVVFYPYSARFGIDLFVIARTVVPPDSLASPLGRVVREVDPDLAVSDVRSMESRIANSLATRKSPAVLAGLFSAMALLLTAVGTYGVLSYAVTQRRREIALRMALGAQPGQIRSQFAWTGLVLLAFGLLLGAAGAWAAGRAMQALLFAVPPLHLPTLGAAAAILGAVSLAGCLLPSYRAARISPAEALTET
jgi:predicted permease